MVLVAEVNIKNKQGHRVLLGPEPVEIIEIDEEKCLKKFPDNEPILYQRWYGGPYGTLCWSLFLFIKTNSFDGIEVPGVGHKVDVLCGTMGAHKVKKMKKWIEKLSEKGKTLKSFSRLFWMKNQQRLHTGLPLLENDFS